VSDRVLKPFVHDCDRCIWVSWVRFEGRWGNMYFCPSLSSGSMALPGSIVVRFSDEPSDYWSSLVGGTTGGTLSLGTTEEPYDVARQLLWEVRMPPSMDDPVNWAGIPGGDWFWRRDALLGDWSPGEAVNPTDEEYARALAEENFAALAKRWRQETGHSSVIEDKIEHPAYLEIIGMGEKAIPLILRHMEENGPSHWFRALIEISGENMFDGKMSLDEVHEAWLEWGRRKGYLPEGEADGSD
jgi:hypothetical protein